jgi:hypothetical protein
MLAASSKDPLEICEEDERGNERISERGEMRIDRKKAYMFE